MEFSSVRFHSQRTTLVQRPILDWVPFLDVLILVVFYYVLTSAFTLAPNIDVRIPKAVLSGMLKEDPAVIIITAENVIYWQNTIVSIKDLRTLVSNQIKEDSTILIKADRRASMGRIVDVWDLCKMIGIQRINIATTRE